MSSSEFANPFPHTALNHFLRASRAQLDDHEAVYVLTATEPSLDHVVAAISYAFLRTQSTQKTYIPVLQAQRAATLEGALPLALQASLIGPENLTFTDDQKWRTATAFGRHRPAILVGGSTFKSSAALHEWQDVQGLYVVGLVDHTTNRAAFEELETALLQQEGSLAGQVTMHFKDHFTKELADLALAAILVHTNNLSESRTSSADLGAVGYLVPRSSFAEPPAEEDEEADDAVNYDAYVPTFPDLDSFYRALVAAASGQVPSLSSEVEPVAPPSHFEWDLIAGRASEDDMMPSYAQQVLEGDFVPVLTSPAALVLLAPYGALLGASMSSGDGALDLTTAQPTIDAPYEAMCVAIAALHVFVQLNWTGPDVSSQLEPYALLRAAKPDAFPPRKVDDDDEASEPPQLHRAALDALVLKGEPAYHLCRSPFLLVFALQVLARIEGPETAPWWRLRASTVHSQVLDEPAGFAKAIFDPVQKLLVELEGRAKRYKAERNTWAQLAARLTLEKGIALQRLGNDKEASELFVHAAKLNGLRYQLSGALGKRTKFQKDDKTQLVLLAKSAHVDQEEQEKSQEAAEKEEEEEGEAKVDDGWQAKVNPSDQVAGMPSTYALNDDLLLEQTQFTTTAGTTGDDAADSLQALDPNVQPVLAVLDQTILLALCLNIRNTQPSHGLTSNQMSSFVSRVISHPRNWTVHTMSLLLRARLEATRTRTVERSVLQLQALIDQMPTNDSKLSERLRWFHALDLPPRWALQAELATRYLSLGVTRSALEIFERVQMWEDAVQCLGMLGRQTEGIELIRDLLEGRKVEASTQVALSRRKQVEKASTALSVQYSRLDRAREAKLRCLLGDLEPEQALQHYSDAWNASRESSARAARSLGGYHFARNDYAQAAAWLKKAVRINPLYTRSWFVLGCCYMRLEEWREAALCFRRCTALDEEDGESWNNLASCYLRMDQAVEVETMAREGAQPDLDSASEGGYSDSGVELSDTESPSPAPTTAQGRAATYNLKLLAHRSLAKSLKYSHESWRVWYNYAIVSVEVGRLGEATRAMVRIAEIQGRSGGGERLDMAILGKLVDASLRPTEASRDEGPGLYTSVRELFEQSLLARASTPELHDLHARLLEHTQEYAKMITAKLNAWKCTLTDDVEHDKACFEAAAKRLTALVATLLEYGPKLDANTKEEAMKDNRFQARSLVRSFLSRTRQSFEDEQSYEDLKETLDELR